MLQLINRQEPGW